MAAPSAAVPFFLFLGASLLLGYVAKAAFQRWRVSELAVLLVAGLAAGPGLGLVRTADLAPALVALAPLGLAVVLFEGGLEMGWRELREHGGRALRVSLAAWGASAAAAALVTLYVLGLPPHAALLLGLALAATGILVVIPLLQAVRAPPEARVVLTLETSLGDLLSAVTVTAIAAGIALGAPPAEGAAVLGAKFAVGAAVGLLAGVAWGRALHALAAERHAYALTLAALVIAFAAAEVLGGSGYLAALAFGLVVGNARVLERDGGLRHLATLGTEARAQQSELIFILKSFYFVALGASVTRDAFTSWALAGSLALVAALLLARAAAVHLALGARRPEEPPALRTLLVACMPRGLATVLIAGVPVALGIPGTEAFPLITFLVVLGADLVTMVGVLVYERRRARVPVAADAATAEVAAGERAA